MRPSSRGHCSATSLPATGSPGYASALASPTRAAAIPPSLRKPPQRYTSSPAVAPSSASAWGNAKATNPTVLTGPSRWRDSKRQSPPSAPCGTPAANSSHGLALLSAAQCVVRLTALPRKVARDLDRLARAAHAPRHRPLRRRLVSRSHSAAERLRTKLGGGANSSVRRRSRLQRRHPLHHQIGVVDCIHREKPSNAADYNKAVARRNRTAMEKSRTLVLIATMRSPTTGSPRIKLKNGLTAPTTTDLSERPHPIFPHARASRRDHETQNFVSEMQRADQQAHADDSVAGDHHRREHRVAGENGARHRRFRDLANLRATGLVPAAFSRYRACPVPAHEYRTSRGTRGRSRTRRLGSA
jgi:hypothetical protein